MQTGVYVDTRFLRPLPKSMWDLACMVCNKRQARWSMHDPVDTNGELTPSEDNLTVVCSSCFLYDSAWAAKYKDGIEELITLRDKNRPKGSYLRGAAGRLVDPADADEVLGYIALTSKFAEIQRSQGRPKGSTL